MTDILMQYEQNIYMMYLDSSVIWILELLDLGSH